MGYGQSGQMGFGPPQQMGQGQSQQMGTGRSKQKGFGMKMVEEIQKGMKAAKKGRAIRELMQIIGSSGDLRGTFTPELKAKHTMTVINLFKGKINNARTLYDEAIKTSDEAITDAFRELENNVRGPQYLNIINEARAEFNEVRKIYDGKIENALRNFEGYFKNPQFMSKTVSARKEREGAKKKYNEVIDARTQYDAVRDNYDEAIKETLQELNNQINKLEQTDLNSTINNAREEYNSARKNYDAAIQGALQDFGNHLKNTEYQDSIKKCEKAVKNAVEALETLFNELESSNNPH